MEQLKSNLEKMDNFNKLLSTFNRLKKQKFLTMGIPLMVLVLGGSLYLEQFSKIRYKYGRTVSAVNREKLEKEGFEVKPDTETTLESQYEKMKDLDLGNWEQKRIQRPWDENTN